MKLVIQHKYLVLPVNNDMISKKVYLKENDELLFDFDCKVDMLAPKSNAYIDVSRFIGKTVDITINPSMNIEPRFADSINLPNLWQEPLRPKIHYTVQNGYNNDPNGLIYCGGIYHMFYQHNPCTNQWGNMHWGHAVSNDLIHWDEQDCALYPDEMGTMFSGCAIFDKENRSGLGENGLSPILLYYTAAGNESVLSKGKQFTQCLAYSTDNCKTFRKYKNNPVLDHVIDLNRDPKVVWVEEIKKYIMVLYLTEDLYEMYSSQDLIHWLAFQKIHIRNERECPDLYFIMCGKEKKWVLSGGSDFYIIGHFTKDSFVIESPERKLTYSTVSYAAQSFSGIDDGRIVRIWWDKNKTKFLGHRFSQQMSIPTEMKLIKMKDQYYLSALPVNEISGLYRKSVIIENKVLNEPLVIDVGANSLDISIKMPYNNDSSITISIFGAKIKLNTEQNSVTFGRLQMPISLIGNSINLRIVVDTCSFEIFSDDGCFCLSEWFICDFNFPYIKVESNAETTIESMKVYLLKSIHDDE